MYLSIPSHNIIKSQFFIFMSSLAYCFAHYYSSNAQSMMLQAYKFKCAILSFSSCHYWGFTSLSTIFAIFQTARLPSADSLTFGMT